MTTTITDDYKHSFIAAQIIEREHEVFHYQLNIDNYRHTLQTLPTGDCPPGAGPLVAGQYAFRDRVVELLVSEQVEQSKAKAIYEALKAQLPADKAPDLITAAAADRASKANS